MNELITKQFDGKTLRHRIDEHGTIWFLAKDVCECLEITNISSAMKNVDERGKGIFSNDTLGGKQDVSFLNKHGVTDLLMFSRKPIGRKFKTWLNYELMPSLEKTGQYTVGQDEMDLELMNDPDVKMMREIVQSTIHRKKQELINQQLKIENAVLKERIGSVENNVVSVDNKYAGLLMQRRGNEPVPQGTMTLKKITEKYFKGISPHIVSEYLTNINHPVENYSYVNNGIPYSTLCYLEQGLSQAAYSFTVQAKFIKETKLNYQMRHPKIKTEFRIKKDLAPYDLINKIRDNTIEL